MVVTEEILDGTRDGVLVLPEGSMPASGRHLSTRVCEVARAAGGEIVSLHLYWDNAAFSPRRPCTRAAGWVSSDSAGSQLRPGSASLAPAFEAPPWRYDEVQEQDSMAQHRYQQYCALARALDVVGDRWTLLIIRELVPGPRRFTDLIDGLPGVSRALLADRLRELEGHGLVARNELPPPAARQVYELTDDGRDLAVAMQPLVAWGVRRMGEREATDTFRPRWAVVAMSLLADREAAKGVSETYQFVVGNSAFYLAVDDGEIHPRDGRAAHPAVTWTTDEETWANIVSGKLSATTATASGALEISGDSHAAERLRSVFGRTVMLARAESGADRVRRRDRASPDTSRRRGATKAPKA